MADAYWSVHKNGGGLNNKALPVPGPAVQVGTVSFTSTAGTNATAVDDDADYILFFADAACYVGHVETDSGAVTAGTRDRQAPANTEIVIPAKRGQFLSVLAI